MEIIICGVSEVNDYIDDVDAVISIMNPAWRIYAPRSIAKSGAARSNRKKKKTVTVC